MNEIGHRCIQIGRQALQTCRHRPMEIGTILADDQKSYFILVGRRSVFFDKNYSTMYRRIIT